MKTPRHTVGRFLITFLFLAASAVAGPLDRLSTFPSCDEFVVALKALKPREQPNIYSRALSIEDFGEGQPDALVVPEEVDAVAEVWRGESFAIIFAKARPKTEASPSVVGIVIVLSRGNDGWKFTGLRRYEAIGKYSEIACELTSEAGKAYTPGHGSLPAILTVTRHSGGRGASESASSSLLFNDGKLLDYK